MNCEIEKQKEQMRNWMISQTAIQNLFKKYGKLPDGRLIKDLSTEEQNAIVNEEIERLKKTQSDNSEDL